MWILMGTTQIKWDYVVIGNYKLRNYSIIAYLQSSAMNVKKKQNKKKTLQKINVTSSHTKTTNRIFSPAFKQNIFHYTRTKWRPIALIYLTYLTDSSEVWIYRVPSVKDTVQQEGATTNQLQIKLYAESYDNNTYLSPLYWIELISTTFNSAFGVLKYAFKIRWKNFPTLWW